MVKIKPFVWTQIGVDEFELFSTKTTFGYYFIERRDDDWMVTFQHDAWSSQSLNLAKRFAFDDFKRRLEETLGEPVGYDLQIDENC